MIRSLVHSSGLTLQATMLLIVFVAWGCGATGPPQLTLDELRASAPEIEANAAARPNDANAQAAAGLMYSTFGNDVAALGYLERAVQLDPGQGSAALALAGIYDADKNPEKALDVLRAVQTNDKETKKLVASVTDRLEYSILTRDMKGLADAEESLRLAAPDPNTLAVAAITGRNGADDLTRFGKALSVMLTTDLARLPGLRLVERQKLDVLRTEIQLGQTPPPVVKRPPFASITEPRGLQERLSVLPSPSGENFYTGALDGVLGPATIKAIKAFQAAKGLTADGVAGAATQAALNEAIDQQYPPPVAVVQRDTAPVAGRLLGASRVFGGIASVENETEMVVNARMIQVTEPDSAIMLEGRRPLVDFYKLSADFTLQTADALGIELSDEQRKGLMSQEPPTRNLAAFLAFGHAVDLEDKGQFEDAESAYRQALLLDPQFNLARSRVEVLSVDTAAFQQSVRRTLSAALGSVDASAAMSGALGSVGTGVEDDRTRKDDKNDRTPGADGPPNGSAHIGGQVPVPKP